VTGTGMSYYRRDNKGALVSQRLPSGAIYCYGYAGGNRSTAQAPMGPIASMMPGIS
jgi:hypothetical protein